MQEFDLIKRTLLEGIEGAKDLTELRGRMADQLGLVDIDRLGSDYHKTQIIRAFVKPADIHYDDNLTTNNDEEFYKLKNLLLAAERAGIATEFLTPYWERLRKRFNIKRILNQTFENHEVSPLDWLHLVDITRTAGIPEDQIGNVAELLPQKWIMYLTHLAKRGLLGELFRIQTDSLLEQARQAGVSEADIEEIKLKNRLACHEIDEKAAKYKMKKYS